MIKILLSAIVLLPLILNAEDRPIQVKEVNDMTKQETLLSAANQYLTFLNNASSWDIATIAKQASERTVKNCRHCLHKLAGRIMRSSFRSARILSKKNFI